MKKTLASLATLLLLTAPAVAQRVAIDNFDQLKVHFITPHFTVQPNGDYVTLNAPEYTPGGELGSPALPTMSCLIVTPFCDAMEIEVENAVYDTVDLGTVPVMPLQPSRSKSDTSAYILLVNEAAYATDAFLGAPLASVTPLGIGRDRHYATLTWSPVRVNPVSGKMIVCRHADVTVHYNGSDAGATMKHYERYYTPAFSLGNTLNTLYTNAKDVRSTAPVRLTVMAPQLLQCTALDEFVDWKRQQGMLVDLIYMANNTAADTYAVRLQQMYDEATEASPAPTYVVLVGDNGQLPAFPSNLSSSNEMHGYWYQLDDHVTDLYFVSWTVGDKLPDCYQGRLSATDTATLRRIIDKTLYYERYQFSDDSYLARAALVAGEDNGTHQSTGYSTDNAWIYSDPTMDYIAKFYVNAANGYDTLVYYKNDTTSAPAGVTVTGYCSNSKASQRLRNYYSTGVGWINYSAHGDWNCWHKPSLTVTNVNQLGNNNKPSIMIGNCCLSNKFDEGTCLGEALLRKGNRGGAVAYIGATNSTFWSEDFYWSVGLRNNVTHNMTLEYDATRMGMYDHLFHTHNESLANQVATTGQMLYIGNMSVNRRSGTSSWTTSAAEYYWEIYELMGDPSLMPWLGRASVLQDAAVEKDNETQYHMTTVPGAYVAFVTDATHELLGAAFADASGLATISLTEPAVLDSAVLLSITAQGYKPYIKRFSDIRVGLDQPTVSEVTVRPNPATDQVCIDGLAQGSVVRLYDMQGRLVLTTRQTSFSVATIPAGLYLLRIESAANTTTRKLVVK